MTPDESATVARLIAERDQARTEYDALLRELRRQRRVRDIEQQMLSEAVKIISDLQEPPATLTGERA